MHDSTDLVRGRLGGFLIAAVAFGFAPNAAMAQMLTAASAIGTFTIAFDREPFALMWGGTLSAPGVFHSHFFDTTASNYLSQSGAALLATGGSQEHPALSLRHEITPTGLNPAGQAASRYVQATSADFSVDADTLAGTGHLGLTGVQKISVGTGIWAGSSLVYGDYALRYDPSARQSIWNANGVTAIANGWFLENHIYSIVAGVYDFANLSLVVGDADNWQMRGDLLISPENAYMLTGVAKVEDVGDFCLGVGSYAGCAAAPVPVPGAFVLFGTGLAGLMLKLKKNS
jgi:hypothetical protein